LAGAAFDYQNRGRAWIVIGGNNGLGVRLRRRMPRVALSGIALKAPGSAPR